MKRKVLLGVGVVALIIGGWLISTVVAAGAFRSITPHGLTECRRLELGGSEDVVLDRERGRVFISSQDFRHREASGDVFLYEPGGGGAPTKVPRDGPPSFHPHGMGLFEDERGARLFVVNHPTPLESQVEIFEVREGPSLHHLESVALPAFASLNEVAPVGPRQFYVTVDAGTKAESFGRVLETFLRLPLAGVGYFDGTTSRFVVTGLRYANGLATDGDLVFVSETTGRALHAYRRAADGTLTRLSTATADAGLDNISVDGSGELWIGAHPNMLAFLSHAKDPSAHSPSAVLRAKVDKTTGALTLSEMAVDDGSLLSGSSVAQPIGGRLLLGTVFEHALDCALPR